MVDSKLSKSILKQVRLQQQELEESVEGTGEDSGKKPTRVLFDRIEFLLLISDEREDNARQLELNSDSDNEDDEDDSIQKDADRPYLAPVLFDEYF